MSSPAATSRLAEIIDASFREGVVPLPHALRAEDLKIAWDACEHPLTIACLYVLLGEIRFAEKVLRDTGNNNLETFRMAMKARGRRGVMKAMMLVLDLPNPQRPPRSSVLRIQDMVICDAARRYRRCPTVQEVNTALASLREGK